MAQFYVYPINTSTIGGTVNVTGTGSAGTPVAGVLSIQGVSGGTVVPVSGTVTVSPLTNSSVVKAQLQDNAGTAIVLGQAAMAASVPVALASNQSALPVTGTFFQATQPVSGTVAVSSVGGSVAVTGTFFQATQPVSGTVAATQSGTWTVQPGNTANTTPWLVNRSTAAATFQAEGNIAFGALTNAYATIFTTAGSMKILQIRNNTNQPASFSLDGGTTTHYVLDPGDFVSLDLNTNGLNIASSVAIQTKYTTGAPTSGSVRVNGAF